MCESGFHCSKEPYDAFSYVHGEWLAKVEVRGQHLSEDNKEVWEEMRVVEKYRWTKEDSVKLAIYAAELVIDIFEKEYPNDDRPRKAIEAAKNYLKNPSQKNRRAAWAAARAAEAAEAAGAAWAAAMAAEYAEAAGAAWAAAMAAEYAEPAVIKKIQKYFMKLVKDKQNGL
jgi:hypothetical protein